MKKIVLFLWQLPQNLLGLLVILIIRAKHNDDYDFWYIGKYRFGVSLGNYIIFGERFNGIALRHERGHQKQSLCFGPLYLLLVGVPSVVINLWDRAFHTSWTYQQRQKWYYSKYPEKWADKLGNVHR